MFPVDSEAAKKFLTLLELISGCIRSSFVGSKKSSCGAAGFWTSLLREIWSLVTGKEIKVNCGFFIVKWILSHQTYVTDRMVVAIPFISNAVEVDPCLAAALLDPPTVQREAGLPPNAKPPGATTPDPAAQPNRQCSSTTAADMPSRICKRQESLTLNWYITTFQPQTS